MNLRWLVKKYPKASVAEIKAYKDIHACGVVAASKALNKPDEKVLQTYTIVGYDTNLHPTYDWVDIPVVVEIMKIA
jgi:hypothetical protein